MELNLPADTRLHELPPAQLQDIGARWLWESPSVVSHWPYIKCLPVRTLCLRYTPGRLADTSEHRRRLADIHKAEPVAPPPRDTSGV